MLWRNVDLAEGIITLTKTKTGKPRRVKISGYVLAELRKMNIAVEPSVEFVFRSVKEGKREELPMGLGGST